MPSGRQDVCCLKWCPGTLKDKLTNAPLTFLKVCKPCIWAVVSNIVYFYPYIDDPIWLIVFKWVETTNYMNILFILWGILSYSLGRLQYGNMSGQFLWILSQFYAQYTETVQPMAVGKFAGRNLMALQTCRKTWQEILKISPKASASWSTNPLWFS